MAHVGPDGALGALGAVRVEFRSESRDPFATIAMTAFRLQPAQAKAVLGGIASLVPLQQSVRTIAGDAVAVAFDV